MNLRTIDETLVREAKVVALQRGTTLKHLVEQALRLFLGGAPTPGKAKDKNSRSGKKFRAGRSASGEPVLEQVGRGKPRRSQVVEMQ